MRVLLELSVPCHGELKRSLYNNVHAIEILTPLQPNKQTMAHKDINIKTNECLVIG